MKTIRSVLVGFGLIIANIVHAEIPDADTLSAIEATTPISNDSLPLGATYYSAKMLSQGASAPPMPGSMGYDAWQIDSNTFLLDDLDSGFGGRFHAMDDLSPPGFDDGDGGGGDDSGCTNIYHFDTNGLWLEIANVSSGLASVNLHNATNYVYEIYSKTDLLAPSWDIETEIFPTDTASMPFTVQTLERTNLFLWSRDWTGITSLGNTAPEWWLWEYFGTTNVSDADLDADGNTLLYDYTNDLDPNIINFSISVTNENVSNMSVPMQLDITAGLPFYEAVLLDDSNFVDAAWSAYTSSNLTVNIGLTEGQHKVFVGLRGHADDTSAAQWEAVQLNLNYTPLILAVTNPASGTVSQPMIQLQGLANKSLSSLTFDVSNAVEVVTNQSGYWQPEFYDTNLLVFTTNSFQCYDIALTNGLNTITLHATDLAGNKTTTNFNFTLDYSGDTTSPVLAVLWPQSGTKISGTNFTAQAHVDDNTAMVTVSIVATNGTTNTVPGLVERSGAVWLENLPLSDGTNTVTITATDAAGNVSTTNLTLIQSSALVTLDTLPDDQLNQSSVDVTGTISGAGYCVYVNGVKADVDDDDGTWEADGVPVNATGTAVFDVEVYVGDPVLVGSQWFDQVQPPMVVTASYSETYADATTYSVENIVASWILDMGGSYRDWGVNTGDEYPFTSHPFSGGGSYATNAGDTFGPPWEYADVASPDQQGTKQPAVMIVPPGQQTAGTTATYLVLASAMKFSDPAVNLDRNRTGNVPVSPDAMAVNGQSLVNTGITNTDGSVSGAALISGASGANVPLVTTTPALRFTFNNQALNFRLTVVSNSAVQINGTTNWATVKTLTNDYVIVQAMVDNASDAVLAGLTNVIQWSGGEAVTNNPLQRRITKTNSVETKVTASLGGSVGASLNVWVIWANLTIKVSGTLDSDDKAGVLNNGNFPTLQSTNYYGLGGGNNLGSIDRFSNTNLNYSYAIGKMEAKAILQPSGIAQLLTNATAWNLKRTVVAIAWDNGSLTYTTGETNPPIGQNDTGGDYFKFLNTANGDLFDLDWPGCPILSGQVPNHTSEVYDNFYEFAVVNLGSGDQLCSATNTYSYTAQIDFDSTTNKIQLNSLSTPLITLPSSPYYSPR